MKDLTLISQRENTIVQLTFDFSLQIISFCEELNRMKKFDLSRQLFKAATSIGANTMEAQNAESKMDFIHKFKVASKEANETVYWLLLCQHANDLPFDPKLLESITRISKVINKIIATSKKNAG